MNSSKTKNIDVKKKISKESIFGYIFVLIPLFGFVAFTLAPMVISFLMQFTDMNGYDLNTMVWNNFDNFRYVFTDPLFFKSIGVTFFLSISQIFSLLICLIIAVVLNSKPFMRGFFQVVYFIPYICSSVAVSLMWMQMFDADTGIINTIIGMVFGENARVDWFTDAAAYPWMIIIATLWQAPGYGIVMFKTALGQVSQTLYEAGDLDGANSFQKFFYITLPSITPTVFYLLMLGIISGLQIFDMPKLFGYDSWLGTMGPENSGLSSVLYIYNTYHDYGEMPRASVMSWILFVVILAISIINMKLKKKWVNE